MFFFFLNLSEMFFTDISENGMADVALIRCFVEKKWRNNAIIIILAKYLTNPSIVLSYVYFYEKICVFVFICFNPCILEQYFLHHLTFICFF